MWYNDTVVVNVELMNVVTGEIHNVVVESDSYYEFVTSFLEQSLGFKIKKTDFVWNSGW